MNKNSKQDQKVAKRSEARVTSEAQSNLKKKPYVSPVIQHQAHIRDITFVVSDGNDLMGPVQGDDGRSSRGGSGETWDNIFDD